MISNSAKDLRKKTAVFMKMLRKNVLGTSKNSVRFLEVPDEFQFKSLYCNDLN